MDNIGQQLFEQDYLTAFVAGAAVWLVRERNQNLGSLLNSEHREFYIQILHRMLYFRREHELEPLNEDIYLAVKPALEQSSGEAYSQTMFNRHLNQLTEWELIIKRMEKERLRGYRDVNRDRFRFRLTDETVAFLYWLEDRLRHGDDDAGDAAGDLLDFILSRLKELGRSLNKIEHKGFVEDDKTRQAANVLFLLHNINEYTVRISRQLNELSAAMESFLLHTYNIEEAQAVISEIKNYMGGYLNRIYRLRQQILTELNKLQQTQRQQILNDCFTIHNNELNRAPRFMRRSGIAENPDEIIARLHSYYRHQGQIDLLCTRTNDSAMKVWGKLSAHLRELERKNNRCEEIDRRINELAQLAPAMVPVDFFSELLAAAAMSSDPNHWDEFTQAEPPQPRIPTSTTKKTTRAYLPRKSSGQTTVISLEEAKLENLKQWVEAKFAEQNLAAGAKVANAKFSGINDFRNIMVLGKKGILGKGRALDKIGLKLDPDDGFSAVNDQLRSLEFKNMTISSNST
ncbi:MAG: DUF2397 family protein [Victivallaceae bacterium]|nr:DUF2397 family protein [Victivallaceae bacterium]